MTTGVSCFVTNKDPGQITSGAQVYHTYAIKSLMFNNIIKPLTLHTHAHTKRQTNTK